MTKSSEEGKLKGLGWFDAETIEFKFDVNVKLMIPHMGWNNLNILKNNPLFSDVEKLHRFYFVHSYAASTKNEKDICSLTRYNEVNFVSMVRKKNVIGMQFHPEKSGDNGLELIKNIINNF